MKTQTSIVGLLGFKDIIGLNEEIEELKTIVDILQSPSKFKDRGVTLPKGVLLHGRPGTGKTLMARALARETQIPFYPVSPGDIKYSGKEGKFKTIKEVFDMAGENAPSIVFIDELDSFIESQDNHGRNEVVLNQLLTAMDGFYQKDSVIVIAATNDIKKIPISLLRPGRFDRKMVFDLPNIKDRSQAIQYFLSVNKLDKSLSIERLALLLEYTTIAEIKHVINETVIHAIKQNTDITEEHIMNAYDRYQLGITKKDDSRTVEQIRRVAIHEAGHAVANYKLGNLDKIVRVSVAKQSMYEGYVRVLTRKEDENTESDIRNKIIALVSGYVAEIAFYGEPSAGSENDINTASRLAEDMVGDLGMSNFGPRKMEPEDIFAPDRHSDLFKQKMDEEIQNILDSATSKSEMIIKNNKLLIKAIAQKLIERKILTNEELKHVISQYTQI